LRFGRLAVDDDAEGIVGVIPTLFVGRHLLGVTTQFKRVQLGSWRCQAKATLWAKYGPNLRKVPPCLRGGAH
jgi:hypothetical protein